MTRDGRLKATATGQHGVITRQQIQAAGITASALRSRVESGFLEPMGSRTYRSPLTPRSPIADLAGLLLDIDGPCWASGPTAAALHGFDGFLLRSPFHVVVPRGRHPQRVGHHIHTARDLERVDLTVQHGLPVLSPTRTLVDLAARSTREELSRALDSALRDGGTSEDFLHRRLVALRRCGRAGVPALMEVLEGNEVTRGGHSWLEREFLRLVAAARLPRPVAQTVMGRRGTRLIRVDARFGGTPVFVELLGYRWHRTRQQMQDDAERSNRLILDGLVPLQFTYLDVVERGGQVVATVAEALRPYERSNPRGRRGNR